MRQYLLLITIALFSLLFTKSYAQVNVQDSLALVDLFDSTDGPNWLDVWNLKNPINTWQGVGVINNRVVNVYLAGGYLIGKIPQSIGNLSALRFLELGSNSLSGTLPASIGRLSSIEHLYLGGNQLSGTVPDSLGNLTTLLDLGLNGNQFTGTIPASLGNLTNLTNLSLAGNQFTGPIQPALEHITNLVFLDISNNQLSGHVPLLLDSLYNTSQVIISGNHFTFDGIEQIAAFEKYTTGYPVTYAPQLSIPLYHNLDSTILYVSAGGTTANNTYRLYRDDFLVATQVGDSAFRINTSGNYFISVTNAIATDLTLSSDALTSDTTLSERDSLALVDLYNSTDGASWKHNTNWLSAQPLSTWYGVTVSNNRVTRLNLDTNNLVGPVPSSIGNLTRLNTLSLDINWLSGDIPSSIGNLTGLTYLSMQRNQFTGSLPSSLGNLTKLTYLVFGDDGELSGPLPASIGNLTNLDTLSLSAVGLTGSIPLSLGNLAKLQYLDLGSNPWSDTIPAVLGNLVNLTFLRLGSSPLTGSFPASFSQLTKLQTLSISNTQINGSLPAYLGSLPALVDVNLAGNKLSGPVPSSLTALTHLAALDLRYNRFTFAGMEAIATKFKFALYTEQDDVPLYYYKGTYSVSVGGTPSNNTYTWYQYLEDEDDDKKVATKKGDSTFTPATPGDYYVEVSNSVVTDKSNYDRKLYLYSEELVLPVEDPSILPASPATLFASREETDTTGWTNYYSDNNTPDDEDDDILVLSLQKRGQDIGTVGDGTFKVQLTATDSAGSNTAIKLTNPLITNPSGFWVMNRFWQVIPTRQPTRDIGVRFYYNNQDVTDINGSFPAHNLGNDQLILYKEVGGSPDPTTNLSGATGIISILPGTYASDTTWTYHALSDTTQYAEFSVASFSGGGGGGTGNGQALPVKLLSFTAVQNETANTLQWTTASEVNANYFIIEKSTNGAQFTAFGTIMAKGNSSGNTGYSFTDNQPSAATTYYRLRMVNTDGTFTYSETKSLQRAIRFAAAIYPNPVKSSLTIHFTSDISRQVAISIITAEGKPLLTKEVQLPSGASLQVLPVASLGNGICFLKCTSGKNEVKLRFVKE